MRVLDGLRIAYFVYVWPEPESSAAGVRVAQNLTILAEAGAEIFLLSAAKNEPRLRTYPNTTWEKIELNSSRLEERLKVLAPDIVLYDRFVTEEQYGSRVERACPNAVRILDTQDLHSLRVGRSFKQKGRSRQTAAKAELDPLLMLRETAAILRSDLTLVLSDFELECLSNSLGVNAQLLHWLPFTYTNAEIESQTAGFEKRQGFCFLGNYQHAPNLDAVLYLLEEIWPRILTQLPQAILTVGGAYLTNRVQEAARTAKNVRVLSSVPSAFLFFESARVNLAPLRFGAGIKGKISEGWRAGTPCVATEIGAEGMGAPYIWGECLARSPDAFASICVRLHEEEELWQAAAKRGKEILSAYFRQAHHAPMWTMRIVQLKENLPALRDQNLLGKILRLEQYRATDFFSRWLELKQQSSVPGPKA